MHLLKSFLVTVLYSVIVLVSLTGCVQVKSYSQAKAKQRIVAGGKLEGLDRVEVIKKFGTPVTTSKSGISESWYYKEPLETWIWFEDGKVTRWQTK